MRVVEDYRISGRRQYALLSEGESIMRVPDEVLKCVAFIECLTAEGYRPQGTAFFVSYPTEVSSNASHVYLVTARHVIEAVEKKGSNGKVYVRVNLKDGGYGHVESNVSDWKNHPDGDRYIDVAAVEASLPVDTFDYRIFPLRPETTATADTLKAEAIGVGDDVFLAGLFVNHYGRERNIPIVRVGNIAAIPEEPVRTKHGEMEAYLIEARSIGGLSGSPVFVQLGLIRPDAFGQAQLFTTSPFILLGLMRGHWDTEKIAQAETEDNPNEGPVNMGVGIVIPVTKILETIDHVHFQLRRQDSEDSLRQSMLPVDDASSSGSSEA